MKNKFTFDELGAFLLVIGLLSLGGCANNTPAPVFDRDGQPSTAYPLPPKDIYTVKSGDTLYSIARDHGMDHRELIALNTIENPNYIAVGRVLKIKPLVATPAPPMTDVVTKPVVIEPVLERRPLGDNGDLLKREPKAGKEAYSDQALAQMQKLDQPKVAQPVGVVGKTELKGGEVASSGAEERTWLWPANGKIVANFSEGANKGVDVAGKVGDPVIAVSDGKVILANNTLRGYGNMVVVKHSDTLITVYAHNSKMLVKEGQSVTKGQKIAEMGNTDADQVKLHFEVRRNGKPVDPLKYLLPR